MKVYTIYTERKNEKQIENLLGKFFDGFTLFKADGAYKGKKEHSLIIEIVAIDGNDYPEILYVIEKIKEFNKQEAILLTTHEVTGVLI